MATMDRRTFLSRSAGFAGAGLFSGGGARDVDEAAGAGFSYQRYRGHEYGVLHRVADLRTGRELLALPKGFSYTTFGVIGATMSDGNITPLALDGMAAFPHPTDPNLVRLIRNHEDRNGTNNPSNRVTPEEAPFIYDPTAGGGCSTLDYDPRTRTLVRDFISLKGTIINCAGGYSMGFRHWLTGEETVSTRSGRRHGYVFPVSVTRELGEMPSGAPIVATGCFSHEAVATDMRTGVVYETEDPGAGVGAGFYRFLPNDPWDLYGGGKLQMLGVAGAARADLRQGQRVGESLCPWPGSTRGSRHERDQQQQRGEASTARATTRARPSSTASRVSGGTEADYDLLRLHQRRRHQERRRQRRRLPRRRGPDLAVPGRRRRRRNSMLVYESDGGD